MGLNIRRSIKIGKNTRLNISKSGVGVSTGVKGARVSVGPRGVRQTVGIPGTGIYYTKQRSLHKARSSVRASKTSAEWIAFVFVVAIVAVIMIAVPVFAVAGIAIIAIALVIYFVIHGIRKRRQGRQIQ